MACGCPVAASDVAAIPEICGGAARLFDPGQPEAIVEAVEKILGESELWSTRGLVRAGAFSWEATARATDDAYARLAQALPTGDPRTGRPSQDAPVRTSR